MSKLRNCKLFKYITSSPFSEKIFDACYLYANAGKDMNIQDDDTGETIMHLFADEIEKFVSARGVGIIYMMACKGVDLDIQDNNGDTFLHKICRKPNTSRVLVSALRSGADPLIKNKKNQIPVDVLLEVRPEGWQETLHYYNKFQPGLYRALLEENPDRDLIRRLLKFWCRVTVVKNRQTIHLKTPLQERAAGRALVELLEEYENTNEFIPALLEGEYKLIREWMEENILVNIDIDTRDHSYQYSYPDYPVAPLPLLAAVWETGCLETVDVMMDLGANTSALFSYNPQTEKPKPLFFHLLGGLTKPSDEIVFRILKNSNMNTKDLDGRTILYEAISQDCSENLVNFLFRYGVPVESRDRFGRTAYDFALLQGKPQYCKLIDEHVVSLVERRDMDRVDELVLSGYDRLFTATNHNGDSAAAIAEQSNSSQLKETLNRFEEIQEHVQNLFHTANATDLQQLKKLIGKRYSTARDVCGRNVLHVVVMKGVKDAIDFLSKTYPRLLNMQDNLGRTPLHYAVVVLEDDDIVNLLVERGASADIKDVNERTTKDYRYDVCGQKVFLDLKKEIQEFPLEVFLVQTNFEESFLKAVKNNDRTRINDLISGVLEHGNISRYSHVLFDCIDNDQEDLAIYLIQKGMNTNIFKQYEACIENDPECMMGECNHTVSSFKDRALLNGSTKVLKVLERQSQKIPHQNGTTKDVHSFNVYGLL